MTAKASVGVAFGTAVLPNVQVPFAAVVQVSRAALLANWPCTRTPLSGWFSSLCTVTVTLASQLARPAARVVAPSAATCTSHGVGKTSWRALPA